MAAPHAFDAPINSLYPARKNTDFTISVRDPAKPFYVLANVEIGEGLNEFVDEHLLQVSVVDRSTATRVAFAEFTEPLKPEDNTPRTVRLRCPSARSPA
ncbi:hypothetical protein [Actinoplanes flavus]|uniref:Uncharacterized protein n=1 Tax=Actinoplanes flavus TaxID=2820290 RepID=A0ABS3UZI4_9ACTN|nr:hypothetical protein [Actinoplanes flavus]MBO3743987.1 hypothetical protein [Actinoplanes flavus]